MASASDVFGSRLEKVAVSEAWAPSRTGTPLSSTKMRRRRVGVAPKTSEWISLRLELMFRSPGVCDLDEWTKRPLLLVGISD